MPTWVAGARAQFCFSLPSKVFPGPGREPDLGEAVHGYTDVFYFLFLEGGAGLVAPLARALARRPACALTGGELQPSAGWDDALTHRLPARAADPCRLNSGSHSRPCSAAHLGEGLAHPREGELRKVGVRR